MDNIIIDNGQKLRVGRVLKLEISRALGLNHRYVWSRLIHKNKIVMQRLNELHYEKSSHFVSRSIARFLAKHFDIYIEGINEEDKMFADVPDSTSDSTQV
ncbi:MAG: hypothetical protein E7069_03775 [Bacteroidales bacterium]|nr:hypothetical protein [Bacteroidales bacterium]